MAVSYYRKALVAIFTLKVSYGLIDDNQKSSNTQAIHSGEIVEAP